MQLVILKLFYTLKQDDKSPLIGGL